MDLVFFSLGVDRHFMAVGLETDHSVALCLPGCLLTVTQLQVF